MPLLYNPHSVAGGDGYPRTFADQAWMWGPDIAHTWYTGSDKHNTWASTVNNVLQNYRGAQYVRTLPSPSPPSRSLPNSLFLLFGLSSQ